MPHESITYRRAELYKQVWVEPLRAVAKRHGVSDVAIGKICRRLGVPLPGRGYWARKTAGQAVERRPLPPVAPGELEELTVNRWVPDADGARSAAATPEELGDEALGADVAAPIQVDPIPVSASLDSPHKLVASALGILSQHKPAEDGTVSSHKRRCLDITVAPASLDRALRIFDALIKAVEARSWTFEVTPIVEPDIYGYRRRVEPEQPSNCTRALVDGDWITLSLTEGYDVVRDPAPKPPRKLDAEARRWWLSNNRPKPRHVPNGILQLTATAEVGQSTWKDQRRRRRLDERLGEIVAGLYDLATGVKRAREQAELREQR